MYIIRHWEQKREGSLHGFTMFLGKNHTYWTGDLAAAARFEKEEHAITMIRVLEADTSPLFFKNIQAIPIKY